MKGLLRPMRSCLEAQIGFRIPVRHPLIAWMVRHAANLICWYAKGHDGRTAYQRVNGRDFRTRLIQFGEFCRFKNRAQESLANIASGSPVHSGVFVGYVRFRYSQRGPPPDIRASLRLLVYMREHESEQLEFDMAQSVEHCSFHGDNAALPLRRAS